MATSDTEVQEIIDNSKLSNKASLDKISSLYMREGYIVILRTDTQLQLIRKKKFSLIWAILGLLLWGIGLLIYIFYYVSKKDEQINITLDEESSRSKNNSKIEELTKLSQLLKDGHLTIEEFESEKKILLSHS